MGIEDIFSADFDESQPVTPEVQVPPVEEPKPEPELSAPPPVQEPIVEQPKEDEQRHVPLATFLDKRDEAKEWKRKFEESEARFTQREQPKAPDPFDDPQGYAAHQDAKLQEALVNQRFATSDVIARQMHGADAVDAAGAWAAEHAKANPGFAVAYMQQAHPIDWIVQQHISQSLEIIHQKD